MALSPGMRLGAFEVLDLIGVGGMGEVYRARDTRLDRTVAIKILPRELSADPDRRARFEREARTISTLNHPHICALYDIGEQDRQAYLVMEHLAGETLAERLDRAKGALAFGDALRIGIDIAEALDHAHKHAIVHRDLKPSNVMLTKAGAKVLDFGLAKLQASQAITLVPDSSVVTRSHQLTVAGTIVGTVPYMAPEQIEGREANARTDVCALGCVLYEMLTGQRAFKGETPGSLVGAILSKKPAPLASLQPLVPPSLERLVARCLAKEPDERWDSTHDIASELRWLAQDARAGSGVGARGGIPAGRSARRRLAWVALGLAVGAGVMAGLFQLTERQNAGSRGVVRFSIEVPPSRELGPIALSPTGDGLAYVGTENGLKQIWVRRFDRSEDEALRGTAGADSPFFSPDGQWIGFFADDRLKKVPADGGEVVTICSAKIESGGVIDGTATWTHDDTIVFSRGMTGLSRVLATGGTATPLTTLDAARAHPRRPLPHSVNLRAARLRGLT